MIRGFYPSLLGNLGQGQSTVLRICIRGFDQKTLNRCSKNCLMSPYIKSRGTPSWTAIGRGARTGTMNKSMKTAQGYIKRLMQLTIGQSTLLIKPLNRLTFSRSHRTVFFLRHYQTSFVAFLLPCFLPLLSSQPLVILLPLSTKYLHLSQIGYSPLLQPHWRYPCSGVFIYFYIIYSLISR